MGLLDELRSGKRSASLGALFVWLFAGGVGGGVLGMLASRSETVIGACAVSGLLVGMGIGLWAAFGASKLARALAWPGRILDPLL